jgi:uncharacterized protein DUF5677
VPDNYFDDAHSVQFKVTSRTDHHLVTVNYTAHPQCFSRYRLVTTIPTTEMTARYREFLKITLAQAVRELSSLQFDRKQIQHLVLSTLYPTILQSVGECYALLEHPTVTAPGILRSILESYADLCAVILDVRYPERMLATFYKQMIHHADGMMRFPANPYHAALAIDPAKEKADYAARLKELTDFGSKPLKIQERFKAADLMNLYRSIYWRLCLEGHNNVVALEARHVMLRAGSYELVIHRPNTPEQLVVYYSTLADIVIGSARLTHNFRGMPLSLEFQELIAGFTGPLNSAR